jgi:hypothetical protein
MGQIEFLQGVQIILLAAIFLLLAARLPKL